MITSVIPFNIMNPYRAFAKEANITDRKHTWTQNVDLIALNPF